MILEDALTLSAMSETSLIWGIPRLESSCGASLRSGCVVAGLCLLVASVSGLVVVALPGVLSAEQKYFVGALSALQLVASLCLLYGATRMAKGCVGTGQFLFGIFVLQEVISVVIILVALIVVALTDSKVAGNLGSFLSTYSWPQPLSEELQYREPDPGHVMLFVFMRCIFLGFSLYFFYVICSFLAGGSFYHSHYYY